MDATFRPHHFPAELFSYAENKKVFEIFEHILENFAVDRPEKPLEYLYDLLIKEAVYNVPKVYVLGPTSVERTVVCSSLAMKLGLIHITSDILKEEGNMKVSTPSDWTDLVKKRTGMADCARNGWFLENFPQTRSEAFSLRKRGIFPTHIVMIESNDLHNMSVIEMTDEVKSYLGNKSLIMDLHKNSYIKTFRIDTEDNSVDKVIEFVRSKMMPPMPYLPRVLLLGPHGSGRKTVAKKLSEKYNLIVVDYHEELRKAAMTDSPLKQQFYEVLQTSSAVPHDLLVLVASKRLMKKDCIEIGWVMYNFPDTVQQAELLTKALEGFQVNRAIFLDANLQTCLDRVEPRRLDPVTGETYHLTVNPCTERKVISRLLQRPQDSAEFVQAEHKLYSENVEQLKAFFCQKMSDDITVEVDANRSEYEVFESVQGAILKSSKMKLLVDEEFEDRR